VCLPDVRATGETAPTAGSGEVERIQKDRADGVRSWEEPARVAAQRPAHCPCILEEPPDIDGQKVLFGGFFAPPNGAEPMERTSRSLRALYEDGVHAVAARGGLAGI